MNFSLPKLFLQSEHALKAYVRSLARKIATKILILSVLAGSLLSCASVPLTEWSLADSISIENIVIASEFKLVNLTVDNINQHAINCVPALTNSTVEKNISREYEQYLSALKPGSISVVTISKDTSAKTFMYEGNKGTCLTESETGYPIFPASVVIKTIDPKGVSKSVFLGWGKSIAHSIATKGISKVAYKFGNGNAVVANYRVKNKSPTALYYSSEFKRIGEWEDLGIDNTFSDPALNGTTMTEYNNRASKFPIFRHLVTPSRPASVNIPALSI